MIRLSRRHIVSLTPFFGVLLLAAQTQSPEFGRELEMGRQAFAQGDYAGAVARFNIANQVQQGKCSECYVWFARIDMAAGKFDLALDQTGKALLVAATGPQRATAQLYRGVVLSQQGNLAEAQAAFRAATVADPECLECSFNLGFVLLKQSKDAEGVQVLKTVGPKFAGTPRGREIQRFIDDPGRVRRDFAPEFSAKLKTGEEVNLDTLKGKVVLLDFWGVWCAPCRVSLPLLKDLAARTDPARFAMISIDEGDSKEKWEQFVQENGMVWPQVYDGNSYLSRTFGVDGFPRYFVLSKDGIILGEFKGWNPSGEAAISNAIAQALNQ